MLKLFWKLRVLWQRRRRRYSWVVIRKTKGIYQRINVIIKAAFQVVSQNIRRIYLCKDTVVWLDTTTLISPLEGSVLINSWLKRRVVLSLLMLLFFIIHLRNVEDEEEILQRGWSKVWKRERCGSKCEHNVKMWVKWVYIKKCNDERLTNTQT